jgi:hypothetical protein
MIISKFFIIAFATLSSAYPMMVGPHIYRHVLESPTASQSNKAQALGGLIASKELMDSFYRSSQQGIQKAEAEKQQHVDTVRKEHRQHVEKQRNETREKNGGLAARQISFVPPYFSEGAIRSATKSREQKQTALNGLIRSQRLLGRCYIAPPDIGRLVAEFDLQLDAQDPKCGEKLPVWRETEGDAPRTDNVSGEQTS